MNDNTEFDEWIFHEYEALKNSLITGNAVNNGQTVRDILSLFELFYRYSNFEEKHDDRVRQRILKKAQRL